MMKYVGYLAAFCLTLLGVRWAIRNGLQEPPEERNLILGYDEDGHAIVDDDCDIEATLKMWREMHTQHNLK